MNRDEVRALARELGIKNVSAYSKAELEEQIAQVQRDAEAYAEERMAAEELPGMWEESDLFGGEADMTSTPTAELSELEPEMREAVEAFIEVTAKPEPEDVFHTKPNRRDIRKAGGRMGLFRMHKRPGSAGVAGGHWLRTAQQQADERVAFLAQQTGTTVKAVKRALKSAAANKNGDKA